MVFRFLSLYSICFLLACNAPQNSTTDKLSIPSDTIVQALVINEHKYPSSEVAFVIDSCFNTDERFIQTNASILKLYELNNYNPLFANKDAVVQGLTLLRGAEYHAFDLNDYGYYTIDSLFALWDSDISNVALATEIDLKLAKGIKIYGEHLTNGKLVATNYFSTWNYAKRNVANTDSVIIDKINQNKISEIELVFEPQSQEYQLLKKEYRKRTNTYHKHRLESIKYPGFLLHKGDSNAYVKQLTEYLKVKGYYNGNVTMVFNDTIEMAIKKFQTKHNLNADGVPGKLTYGFLNWDKDRYLNALSVNMERYRWLPNTFNQNSIVANIAEARLKIQMDTFTYSTKLVVGKYKNQTPVFQSNVDYLVFNPCWTVPNSIATEKMLPKLKWDSNYLQARNMFVGLNGVEQDESCIDFNQYTKSNFPYKIYQRTGPGNALGKVKFMFDNRYSIYLHDTPSKYLFNKDVRTFSQGCMRVQNAMDVADVLLYKMNSHTKSISYYLKKGYPEKVYLQNSIPISIVYFTCIGDEQINEVVYCTDVYSKDLQVLIDLEK